jgi:myo-inositol-1(or 4)-monophosphatase
MLIKKVAEQSLNIVKETADYIRTARTKLMSHEINYKADQSLVTAIDLGAEEMLVNKLGAIVRGARFLAEEKYRDTPKTDLMWIIDPIDGTTNFVHNFPMYCISVALWHNGKIVLGIIYEISSRECFWAHSESGPAFLNSTPIKVSAVRTLSESVLATGFPSWAFEKIDEYFEHFKRFMIKTHGIRRLGSAAMDLAYVACGRCDGFFEYNLSPWDVAAGAYIVQKAGGLVTDFNGGNNYLHGGEILASNTWIHKELLTNFKPLNNDQN